jgi:hypothetical protein
MTELDETIERFARPRRHVEAVPDETETVRGEWAFRALLAETVIALQRRGIEPVPTVLAKRTTAGGIAYTKVAACWPMEIFALTPRGVALPYETLTRPSAGLDPEPRIDSPVLAVWPTPIAVGDGPGDVEVNRRGQLLWRWSETARADVSTLPWTKGFRERFDANWSDRRPGPLVEPVAFAVVDHVDRRIERGVLH